MYDLGRGFYETPLAKSGDPAFYHKADIFEYVKHQGINFYDAVRTFEHFAAYIAIQALTLIPQKVTLPKDIILSGGGWKNPVVKDSFEALLKEGKEGILPEHQKIFSDFRGRFNQTPIVRFSSFGAYMEARLFADLARYNLDNKAWEIPEIVSDGKKIVLGIKAQPQKGRCVYTDKINRAAKGWQSKKL